ncbi:fimbria/pilus periplasmic chaperone [Desulfobacterales bacterium HSG16]|nr:fimbria/pilus periplasmic chaperone [Desulfobacterales bacterium HSG16]
MIMFKTALLFFLISLSALPVQAKATLGIWPVRVNLTPDQKISAVTIRNKGENEVKVQVYAKTWDMDENGKFIETDTGDFVFFPRLLTIPGGDKKIIRAGYNGDFPVVEKPYRLYIQELPKIKSPEQQAVKMDTSFNFLLKLSVPVFVRPSDKPEPVQAEIIGVEPAENGLKVHLHNTGIRNFLLKKIDAQLMDRNGLALNKFSNDYVQRVLPKRSVFLQIPLSNSQCDKAEKLFISLFLYNSDTPIVQTMDLNPGCTMKTGDTPIKTE